MLWSNLFDCSLHSRFGISNRGKNSIFFAYGNGNSEIKFPTGHDSSCCYDGNMQCSI